MSLQNDHTIISLTELLRATIYEHERATTVISTLFRDHPQMTASQRERFVDISYGMLKDYLLMNYAIENSFDWIDEDTTRRLLIAYDIHNEILTPTTAYHRALQERIKEGQKTRYLNYSIPLWLDAECEKELGGSWEEIVKKLHQQSNQYLRVNTNKTTAERVQQELDREGIDTLQLPNRPDALLLGKRYNVHATQAHQDGLFEQQDLGSQQISRILDPQPGDLVIDACAGQGGKALHLSCLMHNKGRIIAMDTAEYKLDILRKRARRASAHNIEAKTITTTKTIKRLARKADKVLLDVPCSALGTLGRHPDIKYHLDEDTLVRLEEIQYKILDRYSRMVKPGGILMYATCSILPKENEQQTERFLEEHNDYTLLDEHHLSDEHTDEYYGARFRCT